MNSFTPWRRKGCLYRCHQNSDRCTLRRGGISVLSYPKNVRGAESPPLGAETPPSFNLDPNKATYRLGPELGRNFSGFRAEIPDWNFRAEIPGGNYGTAGDSGRNLRTAGDSGRNFQTEIPGGISGRKFLGISAPYQKLAICGWKWGRPETPPRRARDSALSG